MSAKLERMETLQLRLPPAWLALIDNYRAGQPARPSRAETIRWLLGIGIDAARVEETARLRITDDA